MCSLAHCQVRCRLLRRPSSRSILTVSIAFLFLIVIRVVTSEHPKYEVRRNVTVSCNERTPCGPHTHFGGSLIPPSHVFQGLEHHENTTWNAAKLDSMDACPGTEIVASGIDLHLFENQVSSPVPIFFYSIMVHTLVRLRTKLWVTA
jgi:hypothetical protein